MTARPLGNWYRFRKWIRRNKVAFVAVNVVAIVLVIVAVCSPLVHPGGVIFGAFSQNGQRIVTTLMDNMARLWDARTGERFGQPQSKFLCLDCGLPAILDRVTEFTRILNGVQQGDPKAAGELLPLVYEELRKLATHRMANEAAGHTLQPAALVHEAWLRLIGGEASAQFQNRAHFFAAATEAMRRILIDRARRKRAVRHGGEQQRVDLEEFDITAPGEDEDQLLAVSAALDKLAREHKTEAELVKLRYFVGMTIDEAAGALGISPRTAKYYWTHARAWLFREIQAEGK